MVYIWPILGYWREAARSYEISVSPFIYITIGHISLICSLAIYTADRLLAVEMTIRIILQHCS